MTFLGWLALIGWLAAAGFGIGWWIDHRGLVGIKSDLADAKAEADRLRGKVT